MEKSTKFYNSISKEALLGMLLWSLFIFGSLIWYVSNTNQQVYELAKQSAIDNFNKDQATRLWGTSHGGIYVTPTERTPPNPYLSHLPDRDVITTEGKKLTLMNPAYMIRQMMHEYSKLYGIKGHATGLVVLNPINKPDEWEVRAITAFKKGFEEMVEVADIDSEPHLRFMRPIFMTKGCEKCHGHLGFRDGDILGGVGVSVPMKPFEKPVRGRIYLMSLIYCIIWCLGIMGIYFVSSRNRLYELQRQRVKEYALKSRSTINSMFKMLRESHSLQEQLGNALEMILAVPWLSFMNKGAILIMDEKEKKLLIKTHKGIDDLSKISCSRTDLEQCFRCNFTKNGQFVFPDNSDTYHKIIYICNKTQIQDYCCVPMIYEEKLLGMIILYHSDEHERNSDEEEFLLMFANMLSGLIERKTVGNKLKQAKEDAEIASHSKGEFLANMSHELRTPLNAILGFSQIMAQGQNLNPEQKDQLKIINRSGEHLHTLINDVLDMSKIEAGRIVIFNNDFDLYRLLDDLKEMFKTPLDKKNLDCYFTYSKDTPQYVHADEAKLRQVLINLLSNAVKFTKKGTISLGVKVDGLDALHFKIEDTGPGIEPKELDYIFDAFLQTNTGKKHHEGTGLGLSISQQFVQLMGGKIQLDSLVGRGSIFSFSIKIKQPDRIQSTKGPPPQVGVKIVDHQRSLNNYRILIVDDIQTNRQVLSTLLSPLGLNVKEVKSGEEALKVWKEWKPHLIWLDIRMPDIDGYEVLRQIKNSNEKSLPVILCISASAFEKDKQKAFERGCDGFISKPFKKAEIFEEMKKHLDLEYAYEEYPFLNEQELMMVEKNRTASEMLIPLSLNWKTSMIMAITQVKLNEIRSLLEEIREQNPEVALSLQRNIDQFKYIDALKLLE